MASPFNLSKSKLSREQYNAAIQQGMQRYGGNRDRAVRDANIQAGFGNSTAQRFMHAGTPSSGGGGGGGNSGPAKGAPKPKARPQDLSGPATGAPLPMDRALGSPDLAVSPQRPADMMWQGATGGGALPGTAVPQNAVPPNAAMSMASILRAIPPELLGGPPNLGLPPFRPGLGHLMDLPPELMGRPQRPGGNNGGYPAAGVFG